MAVKTLNRTRFLIIVVISAFISLFLKGISIDFIENLKISSLISGTIFQNVIYLLIAFGSLISGILLGKLLIPDEPEENGKNNRKLENEYLTLPIQNNSNSKDIKRLFSGFSLENFSQQIKITIILICCVYIPLDCLFNLFPGIIEYTAHSFDANNLDNYFLIDSLFWMILSSTIIHSFVAIKEEFIFREFFLTEGKHQLKLGTSFIYSSIIFGLLHFYYIFQIKKENFSPILPILWGINALIIGFVSGYAFVKTHKIIPVILAHIVNNVLSTIAVRNFVQGKSFWESSFLYMYLPIIFIGIFIFIFNFSALIQEKKEFFKLFNKYWKEFPENDISIFFIDIIIILLISIIIMGL